MSEDRLVKLAVAGGRHSRGIAAALRRWADRIRLASVCDIDEAVLEDWSRAYPWITAYTDYRRMLDDADCDAVYVATPMSLHARQAIEALSAGKHVLSEPVAAMTLDECWELVETVERAGLVYSLAESRCFMRANLVVLGMARAGLFGELTYAEGAYIQDGRAQLHDTDGRLMPHGEAALMTGNTCPTHALGPVSQWLGINVTDRFASTATWMSAPTSLLEYWRAEWPGTPDLPLTRGDAAVTVVRTERGAIIASRADAQSARPHNAAQYHVQGTKGAYLSARHGGEANLVWIDGLSPGRSVDGSAEWETLDQYYDQFDHPWWREALAQGRQASQTGDVLAIRAFIDSILDAAPPAIDVYDAVTWSSILPLSIESVARGSIPVDVPDFREARSIA